MHATLLRSVFTPLVAATVLCAAAPASASDQLGVYAVVRKVKFEPGTTSSDASRVRLCGAFALANINNGSYFGPVAGYMYYNCPAGQDTLCRMQWQEMLTASASAKCVGYGQRRDGSGNANNNGRIRPPSETVANPDFYPVGMGMVTVSNPSVEAANLCSAAAAAAVDTRPCEDPPPDMASPPPSPDMATTSTGGGTSGCSVAATGTASAGLLSLLLGSGVLVSARRRRRGR
ncbi:MAG: hypothetical protein U1A78_24390 [Polyangia bacterium]